MKARAKKVLCLVLALLLTGALFPSAGAEEYEAAPAVQEDVHQLPLEEETAPAELAATGEWLTVPGTSFSHTLENAGNAVRVKLILLNGRQAPVCAPYVGQRP